MPDLDGAPTRPRGGDFSCLTLIQTKQEKEGVTSSCEPIMLAKKDAKRVTERRPLHPHAQSPRKIFPDRMDGIISQVPAPPRRSRSGCEQQDARHALRTRPGSRRDVFHAHLKEISIQSD